MTGWHYRCPKGHGSIRTGTHSYHCRECECSYYGDPYDVRTTEFPINEQPLYKRFKEEVLKAMYNETDGMDRVVAVSQLFDEPALLSRILPRLRSDGYITKARSSKHPPHDYRLTRKSIHLLAQNSSAVRKHTNRRKAYRLEKRSKTDTSI